MPSTPAIGSRWYVWGDHYEIVELTSAGVRTKRCKDGKRILPCTLDAFVKRAVPSPWEKRS